MAFERSSSADTADFTGGGGGFRSMTAGADPGVVRVVRSKPLNEANSNILTILFLVKKVLVKQR